MLVYALFLYDNAKIIRCCEQVLFARWYDLRASYLLCALMEFVLPNDYRHTGDLLIIKCDPRIRWVGLCPNSLSKVGIYVAMLEKDFQWPLLLTWFNFNPSMDK